MYEDVCSVMYEDVCMREYQSQDGAAENFCNAVRYERISEIKWYVGEF